MAFTEDDDVELPKFVQWPICTAPNSNVYHGGSPGLKREIAAAASRHCLAVRFEIEPQIHPMDLPHSCTEPGSVMVKTRKRAAVGRRAPRLVRSDAHGNVGPLRIS